MRGRTRRHNNNIMKIWFDFGGGISVLPMGQQLAGALAEDYRALAVRTLRTTSRECTPTPTRTWFTIAPARLVSHRQGASRWLSRKPAWPIASA